MSVLIKLNNLSISNSVLPNLDVSQDDVELASLPMLKFWLQAGAQYRNSSSIKERASGVTISPTSTATNTVTDGTFTNGAKALVLADAGVYPYLPDTAFDVNKESWTVAVAFERSLTDSGNATFMGGIKASSGEDKHLYFAIAGNGNITLYKGTSSTRIAYATDGLKGKKSLLVLSFDVTRGLTMRLNGVEVARNAADTLALTESKVRFFAHSATTQGASDIGFGGKIGAFMIFDTDLTLPIHQSNLKKLESKLMTRYDITAP